ncbi:TetR/AcrR family transcriptional regulator [Metabacillus endolithicus]|uniref:TetR/AcrR family transcriptional regulator n=1 Tax=Metabacillus endolithicus TaxID=1535204 RepID=A0ABW5BYK6_9BACI|nr:TetR/AcrR family transcriptional regulator [Metabacillus endolithicus]UPG65278.1 TetR/AcrR family transcriptional regulator [Metabacillus endolithicus]
MKEKEKKIIEAAVSIFATKGYSATSIQEIVDACGMSKGAFYLYFKSKDALLLSAFKYQFQLIQSKVDSVPVKDLSPRDAFVLQLKTQLEEIQKNKEFIIMQTREQAIPINSEIEDFIKKMTQNIGRFYHRSLHAIYGTKIDRYIFDLNMILQGIVQSYLKLIILDLGQFDLQKLAAFVLRRADDLVEGYLKSDEEPILSDEFVCQLTEQYPELTREDLLREISLVKNKIDNEAFLITLDVIEEEIKGDSPRLPVIKGMLSNIKNAPGLEELISVLEHYFKL